MLYGAKCCPVRNFYIQKLKMAKMRMLRWMCELTRRDRVINEIGQENVGVFGGGQDARIKVVMVQKYDKEGHGCSSTKV